MSIFPTRILLAADGSRDAELAATTALGLAKATGSELHVVTIAEEYPHHDAYRPLAKRSRQFAQEVLDKQLKRIESLGGTVDQTYLRMGTAAEEVTNLAEEMGAGLVAMGSRGRGRLRRLALGSVSDTVVRHAHCPVMVVRGNPVVFPANILLATDGSEEATLAARTAADLVQKTGSELHLIHVAHVEHVLATATEIEFRTEQTRREAQSLLDEQSERLKGTGGTLAQTHLRAGRPDEEIIGLAEQLESGLILMGSRGLGGVRRSLMGSVSDSVVRHAHCPVLIVREGRE